MKLVLEERDEKLIEKKMNNEEREELFLFTKNDEGKNISIEFEITDYVMASIFVSSFLRKNTDFLKAGIKPKQLSLIPSKEKLEEIFIHMNKAMEELEEIKRNL